MRNSQIQSPKVQIHAQHFQPDLIQTLSLEIWAHLSNIQVLRQSTTRIIETNILLKYEKAILEHIIEVHRAHPVQLQ
jgi:hypothetical protein